MLCSSTFYEILNNNGFKSNHMAMSLEMTNTLCKPAQILRLQFISNLPYKNSLALISVRKVTCAHSFILKIFSGTLKIIQEYGNIQSITLLYLRTIRASLVNILENIFKKMSLLKFKDAISGKKADVSTILRHNNDTSNNEPVTNYVTPAVVPLSDVLLHSTLLHDSVFRQVSGKN